MVLHLFVVCFFLFFNSGSWIPWQNHWKEIFGHLILSHRQFNCSAWWRTTELEGQYIKKTKYTHTLFRNWKNNFFFRWFSMEVKFSSAEVSTILSLWYLCVVNFKLLLRRQVWVEQPSHAGCFGNYWVDIIWLSN